MLLIMLNGNVSSWLYKGEKCIRGKKNTLVFRPLLWVTFGHFVALIRSSRGSSRSRSRKLSSLAYYLHTIVLTFVYLCNNICTYYEWLAEHFESCAIIIIIINLRLCCLAEHDSNNNHTNNNNNIMTAQMATFVNSSFHNHNATI